MTPLKPESLPDFQRARAASLVEADRKREYTTRLIPKRERGEGPAPVSYAQERLWFLDQLGLAGAAYNIALALRLNGTLNVEALEKSFAELARRHESLRTRFGVKEGEPYQLIDPPRPVEVHREDLSRIVDREERERRLHECMRREELHRFDLKKGPVFRVVLLKLVEPDEHALLVTLHHIISDGWSMGVMNAELGTLYAAYCEGGESPLPEPQIQYADYAVWQRQWLRDAVLEEQLRYWRDRLNDAQPLELPTDRARPAVESFKGAEPQFLLPRALSTALQELAHQEGATLFMVMLAAYQVLLARWSGQQDILVGTPIAGRTDVQIEGLIGFFLNTLVLRTEVASDITFRQLLARVKEVTLGAYAHQDVPFEKLVTELRPERSLSRQPLFQVMLVLQNFPQQTLRLPGLTWSRIEAEWVTTHFDLTLYFYERPDGLLGVFEYATDLFDSGTIERMAGRLRVLLESVVEEPDVPIRKLSWLDAEERRQILRAFNSRTGKLSEGESIHGLFEEQARRTPDAIAIRSGSDQICYGELNGRANQLAHYLRERGVQVDEPVALCMERGIALVVGMLGVLKAGAAYVPMDPGYPAERIAYMLGDSAPRVLLTQEHLREGLPEGSWQVITPEASANEITRQPLQNPQVGITAGNLAYVIYTSGSTGKPKGAMNEHRGMVNRLHAQAEVERFDAEDVCCQKTSISFVDAVFEIFGALCHGVPLVIVPRTAANDPRQMARVIAAEGVTRLTTVPSLARAMLEDAQVMGDLERLRSWTLSGEEVQRDLLVKLQKRLPDCDFIIQYGASEVSSDATIYQSRRFEGERVPIGRPLPNVQIYILDAEGEPAPVGVAGQIHVAGVGVGRGYLNRPELTQEKFVANRFGKGRMYCTGDLGRWRADGTIEYLGRNDHQVKIRGFRIELGEIESQLLAQESVREAVVVAKEEAAGGKQLVAYLTVRNEESVNIGQLRARLKGVLPEYMVPAAFVVLKELPRTPNGKLDRASLPRPDHTAYISRGYEAPQGTTEQVLARIWQELLQVERVSRNDNFFELGGHSLLIVKMVEQLRRAGLFTEVHVVFRHPVLSALAPTLTGTVASAVSVPLVGIPEECEQITPQMLPLVDLTQEQIGRIVRCVPGGAANVQDVYPLSPLQEGILFHHRLEEEHGDTYVRPIVLSVASRERLEELIAALQLLIDRHDALRTAVLWEQLPRPVQVVWRRATLPVERIAFDTGKDRDRQIAEWISPARQVMNLQQAPMLALHVAPDGLTGRWLAVIQLHHISHDDLTLKILIGEIVASLQDRAAQLPEPTLFREHIAKLCASEQSLDPAVFFRRKLGDVDEPTWCYGLQDVHRAGREVIEARAPLDTALSKRLRQHAQRLGVSVATLFHSAWALVVARTSGRDDVVCGTVLLGRLQGLADADRMVGMFINTLPLRVRLADLNVRDLVRCVHGELSDLLRYEHASLAVAQSCTALNASTPLFNAILNFRHGDPEVGASWNSAPGIQVLAEPSRTNYPITLSVDQTADRFVLEAKTDPFIDPRRIAEYLSTVLQSLVEALDQAPGTAALDLAVLTPEETADVIKRFNATRCDLPQDLPIHELFQAQVERTPDAIAVISGPIALTYAQLNARSNQLARHLRRKGVSRGCLVGLCVDRSIDMVVGLLGVLKAGGAYVPLDPANPPERINHVLADAAPKVILTHESFRSSLPAGCASVIALDSEWARISEELSNDLERHADSTDLAYVIYTSGSTGAPKGVMVEHRNLVNYSLHVVRQFDVQSGDGSLICTSISFDLMLTGLYPTLLGGRAVRLCPEEHGMPRLAEEVLRCNNLAPLKLTPSHLALLQQPLLLGKLAGRVRVLVLGGEALHGDAVATWKRHAPGTRIFNHYGPTETTVGCVTNEIEEPGPGAIPLGRPIANTQIYILNARLQPVPVGVAGEIHVGGAGVARGYLNRAELTAEKFIPDPFSTEAEGRLYKTGDLGRWRADGYIEYLGRNDDQVKIRGFRVEPGEVEAQLGRHSAVRQAKVIASEDASGAKQLVAYFTTREARPSVEELRAHLRTRLPEYMMPVAFVLLDRFPITGNGKLDKRALPPPDLSAYAGAECEPPRGEIEEALAGIWKELLRVERVGRRDSFFDLGGNSLLVMRLAAHISDVLDVDLPLRVLFERPTIASLRESIVRTVTEEMSMEET